MCSKDSGIKVINDNLCPDEPIGEFNRKIAEIIYFNYSKEIIEQIIMEYEKKNYSNGKE